ncbi:MAG: beta-lactamase family protein [Acidobacteriota bacterium]|nr:beta-lactamase family protein [Acidobacteriota bacterium]
MRGAFDAGGRDRLDEAMARYVERGVVPAAVWALARHDETHVAHAGASSYGGESIGADAIFRLSSMTKPITALLTLALIEDGAFSLDEPVGRLLPELAAPRVLRDIAGPIEDTVAATRAITVRDLLTFTNGFGAYFGPSPTIERAMALGVAVSPPAPAAAPAPDEFVARLASLPLLVQPGERWLYHTGADLLGVLITRATGQPFERVLDERVLAPLGMRDTAFYADESRRDRLVTSYATDVATGGVVVYDEPDGQWARPPAFASGGAGLVGTVADYLAFARLLASGGGDVLSREGVALMTTDHLSDAQKRVSGFYPDDFDTRGWGMGVSVVTTEVAPSAPVGQYGWNGGMGTVWRNDPGRDLTAILLTNVAWTSPRPPEIVNEFLDLAYRALN